MGSLDYQSQPDLARTIRDMQQQLDALKRSTQSQTIPMAKAIRASSFSLVDNTPTNVTWTGVEFDTVGMWNAGAPTRLTVPYAGVYHVASVAWFSSIAPGPPAIASSISVSGVNAHGLTSGQGAAGSGIATVYAPNATVQCDSGDYIELQMQQGTGTGTPMTVPFVQLYLSVFWVGVA